LFSYYVAHKRKIEGRTAFEYNIWEKVSKMFASVLKMTKLRNLYKKVNINNSINYIIYITPFAIRYRGAWILATDIQ